MDICTRLKISEMLAKYHIKSDFLKYTAEDKVLDTLLYMEQPEGDHTPSFCLQEFGKCELKIQKYLIEHSDALKVFKGLTDLGITAGSISAMVELLGLSSLRKLRARGALQYIAKHLTMNTLHTIILGMWCFRDMTDSTKYAAVLSDMLMQCKINERPRVRTLLLETCKQSANNAVFVIQSGLSNVFKEPDTFVIACKDEAALQVVQTLHKCNVPCSIINPTIFAMFSEKSLDFVTELNTLQSLVSDKNWGNDVLQQLLEHWLHLGADISRLQILIKCVQKSNYTACEIRDQIGTSVGYVAFIHNYTLRIQCPWFLTEVITYAIYNKKSAFLRLVEQNIEILESFTSKYILCAPEFWKVINLNELNAKQLRSMNEQWNKETLRALSITGKRYTPEEILLITQFTPNVVTLLDSLYDLGVDKRMRILRSVIHYIPRDMNTQEIRHLGDCLRQHNLADWIQKYFKHMGEVNKVDVICALGNWDLITKYVAEISTGIELHGVLQHPELLSECDSMEQYRLRLTKEDEVYLELCNKLKVSAEFDSAMICEFIYDGSAEILLNYAQGISDAGLRTLRLLMDAQLSGRYNEFKYPDGDLDAEIGLHVDKVDVWKHNNTVHRGGIYVWEADDLQSIMLLGAQPISTCLNYKTGAYKQALLANFDSNKKVVYVKIDGKIVFRASLRLTKSCKHKKLSFRGVDELNSSDTPDALEKLTLFLEKCYVAHMNPEQQSKVVHTVARMLQSKAEQLGAVLLLAGTYAKYLDMKSESYYVYISRTKNGEQYLDSLGGSQPAGTTTGFYQTMCVKLSDVRTVDE